MLARASTGPLSTSLSRALTSTLAAIPAYDPETALGDYMLDRLDPRRTDLLTLVSGSVSGWTSSKLGLALAQATETARPAWLETGFNGLPCVEFDGASDFLEFAGVVWPSGANGVRIIAVIDQKQDAATAAGNFIAWGGPNNTSSYGIRKQVVGGVNRAAFNVGNGLSTNVTGSLVDFSGAHIIDGLADGTDGHLVVDETDEGSVASVPAIGTTRTRVGANSANTASSFGQGALGDAFILDPATPGPLVADLKAWIKTQWGTA